MKKSLLLTAAFLLVCAIGNAQVRKTWDFTQGWSDETKENLSADATNWSVATNDDGTFKEAKDLTKMSGTLMANGVAIKEIEGLTIGTEGLSKSNNFVLKSAAFRLTRKNMVVNLPKLASGQQVTIVARSANSTATDRGLTANNSNMTKIDGPTNDCCTVGSVETTWIYQIAEGLEDSTDVSIKIITGGVEILSIVIDEGDEPAVEEDKQVAYIYNSTGYDENSDMAWAVLGGANGMVVTPIDIAAGGADITLDSLRNGYDAVVISPYMKATDAYVATLKSVIAYEPVLNLNPLLYSAWGYGDMLKSEEASMTITDTDNAFFQDESVSSLIDTESNTLEWAEGGITGVTLGSYFADDDTLAVAGAAVAIHKHNDGRNAYMFLPCAVDDAVNGEALTSVLPTAVLNVAKSKKDITTTSSPSITEEYGNKQTTVTIACGNKKATVYYTTDGSDPTAASTVYTEPFVLTSPLTIKAVAYADGYNASKIVSLDVTIKEMAATPTISVSQESGKSIVTINSNSTDSTNVVYYNYSGSTEATASGVYSEPLEITSPVTLTVFAVGGTTITSDIVSQFIDVKDAVLRLDVLSHFDANRTEWTTPEDSTQTSKAVYYFSWGKSAQSMYDTTQPGTTETVLGEDGQPLKDVNGNDSTVTRYPEIAAESKTVGDWTVESQGQVIVWEPQTPGSIVGYGETGYYADAVEDLMLANDSLGATSGYVNFSGKYSGESYNARLRSNKTFAGPFDIVLYASNGNGENYPEAEVQISTDGETWTAISNVNMSTTKRYYKRTKVSYEESTPVYVRVAHVGGGSKCAIYDLYILNAGTHTEEYKTGIVNVSEGNSVGKASVKEVYNLNGVRQGNVQRGINIVRYSDGTVRKVMGK